MTTTFKSLAIVAGLFFVAEACETTPDGGEKSEVQLSLSANSMEFDENNLQNNTFTVSSNVSWYAEGDKQSLKFEPEEGTSGETEVTVTGIDPGMTGTITVTTIRRNVDDVIRTAEITVSRAKAEPKNYAWAEMPAVNVKKANYKQVTHYANTVKTYKYVRNYSACYDTERHNPMWVAYPLHECYLEGGWTRTKPDPWRPDPKFKQDEQSVIYGSDWKDWPWEKEYSDDFVISNDPHQFWSESRSGQRYGRGHLLRSADRGGHNTELNKQTFYPTNIAPEKFRYPKIHEALEFALPDDWTCKDTIYVVAGCYYGDDSHTVDDACTGQKRSDISKECKVPVAQYKVYLRTKKGNTGKPIQECFAWELMAIGFWLEQDVENLGQDESRTDISEFAMSVDEIEKKIGYEFEFFPEAPDEVTAEYNLSDWGLK